MNTWYGSAGVCVNDKSEILMVLQGTPEEIKTWSVPSGGPEKGETFVESCKREIENISRMEGCCETPFFLVFKKR